MGRIVTDVTDNAPASRAGFKPGDIILKFDGRDLWQYLDLVDCLANAKPGENVDVVVWRDRSELTLKVKLEHWQDSGQSSQETAFQPSSSAIQVVAAPGGAVAGGGPSGVLVEDVTPDSAAAKAGIKKGCIILTVDMKSIDSVADYQKALNKHKKEAPYIFLVKYSGRSMFITLDG
jgi:serine protease Do